MYFTLLVVVILTAIALVAVALGIARAISPVHTMHKREKPTNVVFLHGDGRGCNSR